MSKATKKAKAPITNPDSILPPRQVPYEPQSEHWDADFGNSKEVYQGTALPAWILAGWAIFIIWAIIYLTAGVRTTF